MIKKEQVGSCAICGNQLIEKEIEYSDWNHGHIVVVQGVTVRECKNGHRFFQASVARSLEELFAAEHRKQIEPVEMMSVPVFQLA